MTAPLDLSTIKSGEDAFQYPIPQVRQLERKLRTDLAANKEKLRGLVGESYRDLLQTAERIMVMDAAAQNVESHLGEASRHCNSRLLDRKARNLKDFNEKMGARDRDKYTFAAQLSVLQSCPSVLSRLLHKDDGTLCHLAAKVFVLSRLLLKSLSEKSSLPLLASLHTQFSIIRPILLQHIDTILSSGKHTTSIKVTTLSAFSVLKTSSPSEVLRHFLHIRSSALSSLLNSSKEAPSTETILSCIVLFNKTLADADAIFPQRLSDALVSLKSKSLLQNSDILALPELDLGTNARWLPDDIQGFIPWVRHDDLETGKVRDFVCTWAEKEVERLNGSLERVVGAIEDIESIVKLRSGVLDLWRSGLRIRSKFSFGEERFREIMIARLVAVIKSEAGQLRSTTEKIQELLQEADKDSSEDSVSLWSDSVLSLDLTDGAAAFRTAIFNRVHGKSDDVQSFCNLHQLWLDKIAQSSSIVRDLRVVSTQAQDEEDFDIGEEQAQEGIEDSELAEREFVNALNLGYRKLETDLGGIVESLESIPVISEPETVGDFQQSPRVRRATFLLRVIRRVCQLEPRRGEDIILSLSWFGVDIVPKLHQLIACDVAVRPLDNVARLLQRRKWEDGVVSKPLWEGTPFLPVQPSPLVFRFLHDIVTSMSNAGEDIWTPAAVKCIKSFTCTKFWESLEDVIRDCEIIAASDKTDKCFGETMEDAQEDLDGEPVEPAEKCKPQNDKLEQEEEEHNLGLKIDPPAIVVAQRTAAPAPESLHTNGDRARQRISHDWAVQLLFDSLYLDEALHRKRRRGSNGSSVTSLVGKVDAIFEANLDLDEALRMRLEGSASEYWKRTCLLFALLS